LFRTLPPRPAFENMLLTKGLNSTKRRYSSAGMGPWSWNSFAWKLFSLGQGLRILGKGGLTRSSPSWVLRVGRDSIGLAVRLRRCFFLFRHYCDSVDLISAVGGSMLEKASRSAEDVEEPSKLIIGRRSALITWSQQKVPQFVSRYSLPYCKTDPETGSEAKLTDRVGECWWSSRWRASKLLPRRTASIRVNWSILGKVGGSSKGFFQMQQDRERY
jgi:hypothetical protein